MPMVVIIGGVVVFVSSSCVYFATKKMDVQSVYFVIIICSLSANHFASEGCLAHANWRFAARGNHHNLIIAAAFDPARATKAEFVTAQVNE